MSTTAEMREFEMLLDYLKRTRGFDFTGYKRSTLMRRVRKRMQSIGAEHFSDYSDRLEVSPEEFDHLFNTILINVTNFFRDPDAWEYLAQEILPRLLAARANGQIRVWDAGCSSGEEAYTIAILLAEALGDTGFRERVKIYATDADEEALNQARQATYNSKSIQSVPPALQEKYLERVNGSGNYVFQKELRRAIIFGRHNLVQDAPISRIDLLICRNTLMYFNVEAQTRILGSFHFALNPEGSLFLGKSEMLLTHGNLFQPGDLKRRIFTRLPQNPMRVRSINYTHTPEAAANDSSNHSPLHAAAADTNPTAQLVIDYTGYLVAANQAARQMFSISSRDVGRPLQDSEISYRPVELRSRIEQAYEERCANTLHDVEWMNSGALRYLKVQVTPLILPAGELQGASIAFTDVTPFKKLEEELHTSKQELETAHEELQSTVEELETTNEELQSTNEELETTNEELQSTNEELETMNEELQSTNEELETMNDELRQRELQLNHVNGFMEAILTSLRVGVILMDEALRIQVWNTRSEDLWGLRADEVRGQHLLNLDIGLPVDQLKPALRSCLSEEPKPQELTLDARNRRGRSICCKINCIPLHRRNDRMKGAIILIEEQEVER